jgi:drug/metabolite transporter (DMT)-like permease
MLGIGVGAALLSASTQAIAHAMLKAGRDKLVIRGLIGFTSAVCVLPVLPFVALPDGRLWPWLLLASALHTVYQLVLIRAYDRADFSVAYPVARGVVPIATCMLGVALLGDTLAGAAVLGLLLVSLGLLLVAARRGSAREGLPYAVMAGLLTTLYTLVDGHGMRLAPQAATFIVWFFVLDGLMMAPIALVSRRGRMPALLRAEGGRGVVAGLFSVLTYGSALVALRYLPVGAAAALRETSLVFGLPIALVALGERVDARRLAGVVLVAAGGALVAVAV